MMLRFQSLVTGRVLLLFTKIGKLLVGLGEKKRCCIQIFVHAEFDVPEGHPSDDIRSWRLGFPGGAVVENLPANAGDTGSSPGLGRSHMPRSNWAREPQLLSLRVWNLCSATREAAIVRGLCTAMKSGPRLPQLASHRNEDPTQP